MRCTIKRRMKSTSYRLLRVEKRLHMLKGRISLGIVFSKQEVKLQYKWKFTGMLHRITSLLMTALMMNMISKVYWLCLVLFLSNEWNSYIFRFCSSCLDSLYYLYTFWFILCYLLLFLNFVLWLCNIHYHPSLLSFNSIFWLLSLDHVLLYL